MALQQVIAPPPVSFGGGANGQVLWDNAGTISGISGATTDGTTLTLVAPILGSALATSIAINGTAGTGFLELQPQSGAPSNPAANTLRVRAGATGQFIIQGSSGFGAAFVISGLTTARNFTFPDANGTVALTNNTVSNTLTSAHILVGNASNIATDVAMSGDISITNAGVTALVNIPAISGVNITNLNATNIASGTLADARLSTNVPLYNSTTAFSAAQTVSALLTANSFSVGTSNPFTVSVAGAVSGAGTASLGNLNITSSIIPSNGLYLSAANTLDISTNGVKRLEFSTTTMTVSFGNTAFGGNDITGAGTIQVNTGGAFKARAGNTILTSPTDAVWQFGAADVDTAPVAQTLRFQGPLVGGTSNVAGPNTTIIGTLGKGSANSGDIIIQTGGAVGASGTTIATATTALTIKGVTGAVTIASGKSLVLGNAAATGLAAGVLAATTNATIVITDSAGQAYRIPCII